MRFPPGTLQLVADGGHVDRDALEATDWVPRIERLGRNVDDVDIERVAAGLDGAPARACKKTSRKSASNAIPIAHVSPMAVFQRCAMLELGLQAGQQLRTADLVRVEPVQLHALPQ